MTCGLKWENIAPKVKMAPNPKEDRSRLFWRSKKLALGHTCHLKGYPLMYKVEKKASVDVSTFSEL